MEIIVNGVTVAHGLPATLIVAVFMFSLVALGAWLRGSR